MHFLVVTLATAAAVADLGYHGQTAEERACLDITQEVKKRPEGERAYAVYTECRMARPSTGMLGVQDAGQDCREFARLYQVARHYNTKTFSEKEFCSTIRSYSGSEFASDSRLMDHGACVAGVAEVLASKEVGAAAEKACLRVHPREKDAKEACAKYVAAIAAAPQQGYVDASHLCDHLLTGSGTKGFDEDHFVYSCVQYASNLLAAAPRGEGSQQNVTAVSEDVRKNCEAHLSGSEKDFCEGYADLVKKRAPRRDFVQFCDAQYRRMHEAQGEPTSETSMVNRTQAPAAEATPSLETTPPVEQAAPVEPAAQVETPAKPEPKPAAPAKSPPTRPLKPVEGEWEPSDEPPPVQFTRTISANHQESRPVDATIDPVPPAQAPRAIDLKLGGARRLANSAEAKKCEQHLAAIQGLGLGADATNVVHKDCVKRYKTTEVVCTEVAKLFTAGKMTEACERALAPPPKPKLRDAKMAEMCRRTIEKVNAVGLEGDAFEQAATDVCAGELRAMPSHVKMPEQRVRAGCHFFAVRLVEAQSKGAINANEFCTALARSPPAPHHFASKSKSPLAQEKAHITVPAKVATGLHVVARAKVTTLRNTTEVERVDNVVSPLEEKVVHKVATKAQTTTVAPAVKTTTVAPAVKAAPVENTSSEQGERKTKPRVLAQDAGADAGDQAVDGDSVSEMERSDEDFLSGFLNKYDDDAEKRKQKHSEEVHSKADALFGSGDSAAPVPSEPKVSSPPPPPPAPKPTLPAAPPPPPPAPKPVQAAAPPKTVMMDESAGSGSQGGQDDFLSNFLSSYDDAPKKPDLGLTAKQLAAPVAPAVVPVAPAPPVVAAAPVTPAAVAAPVVAAAPDQVITSMLSTDGTKSDAAAPPADSGAKSGDGDIDSMVSSFLTSSS